MVSPKKVIIGKKWAITKITLIKVLHLYVFDDFCWKKMSDNDLVGYTFLLDIL